MNALFIGGKSLMAGLIFLTAITIDENSLVPIGSAAAVVIGVWVMSAKFQSISDRQKELQRLIDVEINRRLENIEGRLDSLPCKDHKTCRVP